MIAEHIDEPATSGRGAAAAGVKCNGRRRRRRKASCGGSVVAGSAGTAVSQAPACGPAWECKSAQALGGNAGSNVRSRK